MMKSFSWLVVLSPAALPMVAGKGFWSSTPATFQHLIKETYPVGNGRLGGMRVNNLAVFQIFDEFKLCHLVPPEQKRWLSTLTRFGPVAHSNHL
jgi:hypothetical protein